MDLEYRSLASRYYGIPAESQLPHLSALLAAGALHHATYRDIGTLWEGLYVYRNDERGFRGFSLAVSFSKHDPDLDAAYELLRGTGISLGSFGHG